jgi:hypothetical protein
MFSRRWSTFSLLSLILLAGVSAFFVGRMSVLNRQIAIKETPPPPSHDWSKNFSKTVETIHSDLQPGTESREIDWTEASTRPRTPANEGEMAAAIEKLAEHDPQRAISLAQGEANLRLRAALLRAVLQGWGKSNPDTAAAWVQSETVMDREQAVSALLQGAIYNPDKAAGMTAALMQNDTSHAAQYGSALIWAFADSGQFSQAADFAANGAESYRSDWMLAAYSRWAEFQPQSAVASAIQLQDAALRETALNAVIVGWSPTDPKGMAEFALNNLSQEQQSSALSRALTFWADNDPAAAATWINQNNPGAQSDPGVAEIAMSPQMAQEPDVAASWAKTIVDPNLRFQTLASIMRTWSQFNPAAAREYLETSSDIRGDDLVNLLTGLNDSP